MGNSHSQFLISLTALYLYWTIPSTHITFYPATILRRNAIEFIFNDTQHKTRRWWWNSPIVATQSLWVFVLLTKETEWQSAGQLYCPLYVRDQRNICSSFHRSYWYSLNLFLPPDVIWICAVLQNSRLCFKLCACQTTQILLKYYNGACPFAAISIGIFNCTEAEWRNAWEMEQQNFRFYCKLSLLESIINSINHSYHTQVHFNSRILSKHKLLFLDVHKSTTTFIKRRLNLNFHRLRNSARVSTKRFATATLR